MSFQAYLDNIAVKASAVPEPATYATIASLGALVVALWRKRRKTSAPVRA